jgi:phosphate transport system substrate-binding protein
MLGFIRTAAAIGIVALGTTVASAQQRLSGAGSSFIDPLFQRWVTEYQKSHPQVQINYTGNGSGAGVKGITEKTIDFGASDAPLSAKELAAMGGADKVVQVPMTAGGVVPAYNLPGVSGEVKFTGEVLADIYLGKIKKWNDPKLAELNSGIKLPDVAITPAYRSDGSGTTYIWTSYLSTQSEEFKGKVGASKSVQWPAGQGGAQNAGVAAIVQQTVGGIGYIEQAYADQNKIPYGAVKNKNGKFLKASPEAVSAAGAGAMEMMKGDVIAADIWNQPGDTAYPISGFTYVIIYKDLSNVKSKQQAEALVGFLRWAVNDGQAISPTLDYAPLASGVKQKVMDAISHVTYQGNTVAMNH